MEFDRSITNKTLECFFCNRRPFSHTVVETLMNRNNMTELFRNYLTEACQCHYVNS